MHRSGFIPVPAGRCSTRRRCAASSGVDPRARTIKRLIAKRKERPETHTADQVANALLESGIGEYFKANHELDETMAVACQSLVAPVQLSSQDLRRLPVMAGFRSARVLLLLSVPAVARTDCRLRRHLVTASRPVSRVLLAVLFPDPRRAGAAASS